MEKNEPTAEQMAMWVAIMQHKEQVDKQGIPYIYHVMVVASGFTDPVDRTISLLHDVVEDTPMTVAQVRELFGDEVAGAVDALTHVEGERWESYIGRVLVNERATRVKIADVLHNLSEDRVGRLDPATRLRMDTKHRTYLKWLTFRQVTSREVG